MATSKPGSGLKPPASTPAVRQAPVAKLPVVNVEAPAPQRVVVKTDEGSSKPFILQVNGLTVARYRTREEVRRNLQRFK